ncbi:hypothetical protein PHYSODRAFT_523394, partial [Phytophthora sojae]
MATSVTPLDSDPSGLQQLRQRTCSDLDDYIAQFRQLLSQIRGMGDLDGSYRASCRRQEKKSFIAGAKQFRTLWLSLSSMSARTQTIIPIATKPEPTEIGTVQVSREECRRKRLCFYCKQAGHMLNRCPKRGNAPSSHVSPAEAADSIHATRVIHFNMARIGANDPGKSRQGELLRKNVVINGKLARALIDSGADTNLIRPGYLTGQLIERKVNIEGFDGARLENVVVKEGVGEVTLDQQRFLDVILTEFDL